MSDLLLAGARHALFKIAQEPAQPQPPARAPVQPTEPKEDTLQKWERRLGTASLATGLGALGTAVSGIGAPAAGILAPISSATGFASSGLGTINAIRRGDYRDAAVNAGMMGLSLIPASGAFAAKAKPWLQNALGTGRAARLATGAVDLGLRGGGALNAWQQRGGMGSQVFKSMAVQTGIPLAAHYGMNKVLGPQQAGAADAMGGHQHRPIRIGVQTKDPQLHMSYPARVPQMYAAQEEEEEKAAAWYNPIDWATGAYQAGKEFLLGKKPAEEEKSNEPPIRLGVQTKDPELKNVAPIPQVPSAPPVQPAPMPQPLPQPRAQSVTA